MARLVRCFATAAWLPACCRCMAMQAGGRWLHPGDAALPPLVEVPGAPLTLLERIVKPPDAETLYEWQTTHGREEDPDPSWASVWPAAAALSARIAEAPQIVRGHSVIELGSGLGVVALTAAAAGAANVTLVDREPLALHCAMSTAALNGLTTAAIADTDQAPGTVRAAVCSWADTPSMLSQGAAVIVGSEVLYDPSCVEELASCVATLLQRAGGGHLLLAEPHKERAPGCRSALCARLVELGASEVREEPLSALETAGGGAEPLVLLEATFTPRRSASSGQPAAPAATCASDPKPPRMSCARRSVTAVAGVLASALSVSLFGGHVPRALWTLPAAAAPEPTSAAAAETAAGMAAETAAEGTGVTDASEYVERAAADLGAETARVTIEKLEAPPEGGCRMVSREGDVLEVAYEGRVQQSGKVFDTSATRPGGSFTLLLGNGDVGAGLEIGLYEMCIGESRRVRVPSRLGFGRRGSKLYGVPPDAAIEYRVKLLGVNQQRDPMVSRKDLPDEQRF